MINPLGTADFFALEAGECLDRLESLLQGPNPPAADEFLRMARVLRGSALMAGQPPIAKAAAGLEAFARVESFGWNRGSIRTLPINHSAGPLPDGCEPLLLISISKLLYAILLFGHSISKERQ